MSKSALPTGTVIFLFTDIEGSTQLAQAHPAEWEAARARHHAILRAAAETRQGYVFQVIGDAFRVEFHNARDGLTGAGCTARAARRSLGHHTDPRAHGPAHGEAVARDGATACAVARERGPTGRGLSCGNAALCDDAIEGRLKRNHAGSAQAFGASKFTGEAETIGILNAKGDLLKRVGKFARTESEIGGLTLKSERLVKIAPQEGGKLLVISTLSRTNYMEFDATMDAKEFLDLAALIDATL